MTRFIAAWMHQTEADMSDPGLFASNYEAIERDHGAREMVEEVVEFDKFTQAHARDFAGRGQGRICGQLG